MQLRRAILDGNKAGIEEINKKLSVFSPDEIELNHVSGFSHPRLLIYGQDEPYNPKIATWGLVPNWVKNLAQRDKLWNQTLNARSETLFDKPSFKDSAENGRCLIYLQGFYEHRHHKGKTFPYYIHLKNRDLFAVAGLYSAWKAPETNEEVLTFSIVTTSANPLMAKIHNNPKLKEPRMPLILPQELENDWLKPINDPMDRELLLELVHPYHEEEMEAHTVGKLRGKEALGNVPEAVDEVVYAELEAVDNQGTLF
jgi:putative SOS response-associated peptidase YedK